MGSPRSQSIVAKVDWGVLKPLHEMRRARPLLTQLQAVIRRAPSPPSRKRHYSANESRKCLSIVTILFCASSQGRWRQYSGEIQRIRFRQTWACLSLGWTR